MQRPRRKATSSTPLEHCRNSHCCCFTISVCLQISVELRGRLQSPGDYVPVVEYSSEEESPQTLTLTANVPGSRSQQFHLELLHCKFRYGSRGGPTNCLTDILFYTTGDV